MSAIGGQAAAARGCFDRRLADSGVSLKEQDLPSAALEGADELPVVAAGQEPI